MDESEESVHQLQMKLLSLLQGNIPYYVKLIFGENDTKEMIKFVIDSLGVKKINKDLHLQMLDVCASQILASCKSNYQKLI